MNGPEYRWRKRLDARAERRRRKKPVMTKEQALRKLALESRFGLGNLSQEQRDAQMQAIMERQRMAGMPLTSRFGPLGGALGYF